MIESSINRNASAQRRQNGCTSIALASGMGAWRRFSGSRLGTSVTEGVHLLAGLVKCSSPFFKMVFPT